MTRIRWARYTNENDRKYITEFLSSNFKGREHSGGLRLRMEVDLEMDVKEI